MTLTKDQIKDTVFELECERDELQSMFDTMKCSGWSEFGDAMDKAIQELQDKVAKPEAPEPVKKTGKANKTEE